MTAPRVPVGLVPAAGRGVRFGASGYAKELFPLLLAGEDADDLEPRPICELALRAIRATGAETCVMVVSPEKSELVRVVGSGEHLGLSLAYVVQTEARGLPDAVRAAEPWLRGRDVVFAMPDTVFLPSSALADVEARRAESGADLLLGVFPVDEPERLGPVDVDAAGVVRRVYDKPATTTHRNTWGVASWGPRFTAFCLAWAEGREGTGEPALGHVFEAARGAGLDVQAVLFPEGRFLDIGTPRGLRDTLAVLASSGVLFADQATTARREPGR